jgi:hypothetical protein
MFLPERFAEVEIAWIGCRADRRACEAADDGSGRSRAAGGGADRGTCARTQKAA